MYFSAIDFPLNAWAAHVTKIRNGNLCPRGTLVKGALLTQKGYREQLHYHCDLCKARGISEVTSFLPWDTRVLVMEIIQIVVFLGPYCQHPQKVLSATARQRSVTLVRPFWRLPSLFQTSGYFIIIYERVSTPKAQLVAQLCTAIWETRKASLGASSSLLSRWFWRFV